MGARVDAWYYGFSDAPNGVATFLRYFNDKFKSDKDVEFEIYSLGSFAQKSNVIESKRKRYLKKRIKDGVIALATWMPYFPYFFMKRAFISNANKVIFKFQESEPHTVLFFQDFFTCYAYFSKYRKSKNNSLLVLHSDGIPLKMILQTYPFLKRSKRAMEYLNNMVDFSLARTNKIVFLSHRAKANFLALYSQYESKIHVIYNGLDDIENRTYIFGKDNLLQRQKIKIASVGTVGERKGFDFLVKAFVSLPKNIQDKCELHIIGDGPLRDKLEKRYGGKCNITFWGKRHDVNKILEEMDVFALVSRDEGMPMAVIEAMRQGKALLLTDVGGMSEMVIENENGWLVKPDFDSVYTGFERIFKDAEKIPDFSRNSRDRFLTEFQGTTMIEAYKSIFKSLANHVE